MYRAMFLTAAVMLAGCAASNHQTTAVVPAEAPPVCRAETTPTVDVSFDRKQVPEDRSQNAQALTAIDTARGGHAGADHINVITLAETQIESAINLQATTRQLSNGTNCVWLTSVRVAVTRKDHVSIASELVPGSCPDAIMKRQAADMIARAGQHDTRLKQKITEAMTNAGQNAVADASLENAQRQLEKTLSDAVNAQVQQEAAVENKELDALSQANVLKNVADQCHDAATRHLMQALAGS